MHNNRNIVISIIGYGSWGKALTKIITEVPHNSESRIIVCTKQDENIVRKSVIDNANVAHATRRNISNNLTISNDVLSVIHRSDIVIIATQAKDIQVLTASIATISHPFECDFVITSKGIDTSHGRILSSVLYDAIQYKDKVRIAALSGPNFASEIMLGKHTVTTVASTDEQFALSIAQLLSNATFSVEVCTDIIGVQVCGMMKNVFAIGYGMLVGSNSGENIKAAFLTRALREIMYAIGMFGGQKETVYTMAGIGDLIMTGHSDVSRNHLFGKSFVIGAGVARNCIMHNTVEGYHTLMILYRTRKEQVELQMPICSAIYNILTQEQGIDLLINSTMHS